MRFRCVHNKKQLMSCPSGLMFSEDKRVCDHSVNVDCAGAPLGQGGGGGQAAHPPISGSRPVSDGDEDIVVVDNPVNPPPAPKPWTEEPKPGMVEEEEHEMIIDYRVTLLFEDFILNEMPCCLPR